MEKLDVKIEKSCFHRIFIMCILIATMAQIYIDTYLPALPEIKNYLHASKLFVQISLPVYFFMRAFGSLFAGTLSDYYGRKKIVLTGLAVAAAGAAISLFADSVTVFLVGRALQGLGLGIVILVFPIIFDTFKGKAVSDAIIYMTVFYCLVPVIGPYIGGSILKFFPWQGIFAFLLIYLVLVSLGFLFLVPETLVEPRLGLSFRSILRDVRTIVRTPQFLLMIFIVSVSWGGTIAFNVMAPFLYEKVFHLSAYHYGIMALGIGISNVLSTLSNKPLQKRFQSIQIVAGGVFLSFSVSGILFALTWSALSRWVDCMKWRIV